MTSSWLHYQLERDLELQIAAGETPLDVVAYFIFGTVVWVVTLYSFWP